MTKNLHIAIDIFNLLVTYSVILRNCMVMWYRIETGRRIMNKEQDGMWEEWSVARYVIPLSP